VLAKVLAGSGNPLVLLDTKYKTPSSPSSGDVEQVIAYAKAVGCPKAALVYPQDLPKPFDYVVGGDIHVWTTTFALSGDLDERGQSFVAQLMDRSSLTESQSRSITAR